MKQLTQEEYDQRALMEMTFISYYKYTFGFESKYYDGKKVIATYGGGGEDIYRLNVDVSEPWKLEDFDIEDCYWG